MMDKTYYLGAYWSDRRESVSQCATRLLQMFEGLSHCHQTLRHWYKKGNSIEDALKHKINISQIDLEHSLSFSRSLEAQSHCAFTESPMELGFSFHCWNGDLKRSIGLNVSCGGFDLVSGLCNSIVLNFPPTVVENDDLLDVCTLQCILVTVVQTWRPDWAVITSHEYVDQLNPHPDKPFIGWLSYLKRNYLENEDLASICDVNMIQDLGPFFMITKKCFSSNCPDHVTRANTLNELLNKNRQG